MTEFVKPSVEYFELWPLLVVFGVACVGVLVEAFAPRSVRYVTQVCLALVGLVVALVGVVLVAQDVEVYEEGAARGILAVGGTIAVDGPSLFIWGLVLALAIAGVLLFAERHLDGGVSAFAGQAAALPGTDAESEASRGQPGAHRGLPADDVRGLRHDALPGRQRPAHHVRRPGDPLAPALPPQRPGPSPAPAEPGSRPEVLPARSLLVGLLPLRRRHCSTATPARWSSPRSTRPCATTSATRACC